MSLTRAAILNNQSHVVDALIAAFRRVENRNPSFDEICRGCHPMTQAQVRVALRKLERQDRIRHVVTFEPINHGKAQPQP